eukprot:5533653-Alexandrium_andersonii.AAC.1
MFFSNSSSMQDTLRTFASSRSACSLRHSASSKAYCVWARSSESPLNRRCLLAFSRMRCSRS